MTYLAKLKEAWDCVYDPQKELLETMDTCFHEHYEQCINGVSMNRAEYIQHVLEQRKNFILNSIDYKHVLEKGNELFALYYPRGKNSNNLPVEAEVIAYFRFENDKIYRIHGQVRLIKGDLADVDMRNT